ncbi:NYN domain-containing protein [Hydrocarboniclastica marina]|uniref:NYN domain-containing protein n=1 Tax=Hydrocarboniclastica marina TaxID=2259620 RepID=A0A4P7XIK6_9ALTE|nr:NYN domain-containing protein [Hydrocarboniclastica marina]QCF26858.1 NYN domain-containing protein [Hydrocarboniclastica marina]
MDTNYKIGLLIDCDNVSHQSIEGVLQELAKFGAVNVRHAHGNWNGPQLGGWIEKLHSNAIRPIQQFAYTAGKNATDASMIIDAMDLLYSGNVDAFALMTSDSDFTPLAMRILEAGLPVFGFGALKTPMPFVNACSQFIYTENLSGASEEQTTVNNAGDLKPAATSRWDKNKLRGDSLLVRTLRTAVEQTADDDGWAHLARVGQYISNNSSFSPVNYGYKKLSDLLRASKLFEIDERDKGTLYIKSPG